MLDVCIIDEKLILKKIPLSLELPIALSIDELNDGNIFIKSSKSLLFLKF